MAAYLSLRRRIQGDSAGIAKISLLYIIGIVVFGCVPEILLSRPVQTVVFGDELPSGLQVVTVAFLAWLAVFISLAQASKSTSGFRPSIQKKVQRVIFITIRVMHLAAYETYFRGYLLTELLPSGLAAAILLNTGLYALLHCLSPAKEFAACVPFGALLCILCFWLNAAWPAVVIHLALGVSYESALLFKPRQ